MITMWAWRNNELKVFTCIYPSKKCVKMCSPDGFKSATKRGEGKIVKVKIIEVA